MKSILKTFPRHLELKYGLKFNNETNRDILKDVIPRLVESMKPKYHPFYKTIERWLSSLHKHHRVRLLYKNRGTLDKDNRRLHKNNRINKVKKDIFLFIQLYY